MNNRYLTSLYYDTLNDIISSPNAWMDFLECAAMNYRHLFNNQVLIYAQRPEAVLCATLEEWNTKTGRWVIKNSKGIAIVDESGGVVTRKYVFGLDDTSHLMNEKYQIWGINKLFANEVIDLLGYSNINSIEDSIMLDISNMLIDEEDMELEDFVKNSVAYMVLRRSGLNPKKIFNSNDFSAIDKINNLDDIIRMGLEIKELSTIKLDEIRNIVIKIRENEVNKICTFDKRNLDLYNEDRKERSGLNDRIQTDRRLSDTKSSITERGADIQSGREIRDDEIRLSETREEVPIYRTINEERTITTFNRNTDNSTEESKTDNNRNETERESDRETKRNQPNEMGRVNEQYQEISRRNSNERSNLQLDVYEKDENAPNYVVINETINRILVRATSLKVSNEEIKNYFNNEKSTDKRVAFLMRNFNEGKTDISIGNNDYWYKAYSNGVQFYHEESIDEKEAESFVKWEDLVSHYEAMILLNQLHDMPERLKSENEQITFIENELSEKEDKINELEFTQEFIDRYLQERHTDYKYDIYQQFQKGLSIKENAEHLKNLYGWQGSTETIKGAGVGFTASSKGITFHRGYFEEKIEKTFTWNYIAKRINTLIKENRYLNEKEMKEYPNWLEERQQLDDMDFDKIENISEEQYEYHLGDKVYIGVDEYEILNISDFNVVLYDYRYPLFNREMSKEEFDKKIKENPANDHLKIVNTKDNEFEIKTDISEKEVNHEIPTEKKDIELVPSFENKRKTKITTFDIHPEINFEDRNQFVIDDDNLGVGTHNERVMNNIAAINTLKKCEEENRFANLEEQKILSKYVGWGGLSDVFEETNSLYSLVKQTLTEDEYIQARTSTLTAFYTPPIVVRSMYKALINMGLKEGNILEPSCGIGNFFGMLPDELSKCKLYGIELDSISGRIARQLYQKSSIAIQGYENTKLPNSFFDVAIGNVPFERYKVSDKKYDKYGFMVHDYFFAKTIDKIRPNGVIAFITSSKTMDKSNNAIRKYIAQRADLLGAIRLPNTVYEASAGTKVTSDILFLQKRESITERIPEWAYLDTNVDGITMNSYFVEHPEMIIGEMKTIPTQFGPRPACILEENQDLERKLSEAIETINIKYKEQEIDEEVEEDLSIAADINVRNFSYTLVDGDLYFRENSRMYPQNFSDTKTARIKALMEIRDCTRTLMEYQLEDYPEQQILDEQHRLNELYDNFTKKYGLINSKTNDLAFSNDSSYYLLCSLEILDDNGKLIGKADMFNKRTIKAKTQIYEVENANDALIMSISEKARVDIDYMQGLCYNMGKEKMIQDLEGEIFLIPSDDNNDTYQTADEYLSGNVREKLRVAEQFAKEDERFNINVKYLKEVQPKDLNAGEIGIRLGSTWIPPEIIRQFIEELLEPSWYVFNKIKVHFTPQNSEWNIEGKSEDKTNVKSNSTYGTSRANAYRIIEDTLNLKDTRIYDYYFDEHGARIKEFNKKETAIAQAKQESIKLAFNDWVWKDAERREKLIKIYNERFNSIRPREYNGSYIKFEGINPEITLRPHQINAIARILYGGNTLLAHEVGAGKTFEMVAAAMESKRLGLCNKSLFVVPNHIVEQFGQEFLQLYPSANILVTTKKDFQQANRKKFCSRIATGDYDAVIMSHSQFEKIPMSVEQQILSIEEQINRIVLGINEAKTNNGEHFTIKQMEKLKKTLEYKLDKLNNTERKDDVVTFEELGVDKLFVDEAHYYKNLYLYTKMRNVGGIAQTEAQKSSDLFMKCRYLDKITDGKGVVFATGTPISNSMVELYTMQRYLQYHELEKRHLENFDSWASTFGETITAIELAPEGTGYRSKTRFAKFFNLPELMAMFKEVADIQTEDMLDLPLPKVNYHNVIVKPSNIQKELVQSLGDRAELVRNRAVDRHQDNMLKITNDGRKIALDQRLYNEMLEDDHENKVSVCANNVYNIWEKNSDKKSAQLIFCDLSTPKKDGSFSVYNDIKKKLIDKGIPKEEIAFIHDFNSDSSKQKLFNQVRKGNVRVLMGSTQKMGAGTNCQDKLLALHDLDCPWRPSDLKQRCGRIKRQGNENPEIDIYRYVTEQTFDAYLYQLVESKQKFVSQVFTSKVPLRTMEDIDEVVLSYAEIKALASGNPLVLEKTELDTEVSKLRLLKQTYLNQKYEMEDKVIKVYPKEINKLETKIESTKEDIGHLKNNTKPIDGFQGMIINDISYDDKAKAGQKLIELCKSMKSQDPIVIGEYKGFKMSLSFDSFDRCFHLGMKNRLTYDVELGSDIHGNITRIDNVLNGIDKRLVSLKSMLEDTKRQYENTKKEIEIPFSKEEELQIKTKRLNELNIQLNIGNSKKENKKQKCEYAYER